MVFENRPAAGEQLARHLKKYKQRPETIILGLPRGGVVVAYEIATKLKLPLDVIVPRKVGEPGNPELALGAVTETGEGVFDEGMISRLGVDKEFLTSEIKNEQAEAQRRLDLYRQGKEPLELNNKTVILVDDGIATGATMRAAVLSAKTKGVTQVIVAVPVASQEAVYHLNKEADDLVVLDKPTLFMAVGDCYQAFPQVTDEQVVALLKNS
jgi:putative phosphoribosyl transferase